MSPEAPQQIPEPTGGLPASELAQWEEKAAEARFTELDRVKASAGAWATFNTGLLGALGIAGVTVAPESIAKVRPELLWMAVLLAFIAVLANVISVFFAYRGARTATDPFLNNGSAHRRHVYEESKLTRRALKDSRTATVIAFSTLLGLAALTIFFAKPTPDTTNDVLAVMPTGVVCGPLGRTGEALTVNGKPLEGATSVVATTCP